MGPNGIKQSTQKYTMGNPITILRGEGQGREQAGGVELKLEPTGIFVNTLVYVVYSVTAIGGK